MIDGDLQNPELPPELHAAGGFRAFQFSLKSLYVIVAVIALILSIYFSVGPILFGPGFAGT